MRKHSLDVHRVHHSIRLVVTLFVLLGFLFPNVTGNVFMSLLMQPHTTVTSPPVALQDGTVGESTIYENGTSALVGVSAPLSTYFPNSANVITGTYMSGTMTSLRSVDSDRYVVQSAGTTISATTYNPDGYSLLGSTSWISGSVSSLTSNDSVYTVFRSYGSASTATSYNPSGYALLGSTTLMDGTTSNLTSNDASYMIFRSHASPASSTEYAHVETQTIGSSTYYKLLVEPADTSGTTLSLEGNVTGRTLFGKFVYPLSGVSSIPAGTWTFYYRAYRDTGSLTVHCDVDILIRMANDTVRQTITTDAATSPDLDTSWATVSGNCTWAAYTVVDQTDYLEIDYYANVTKDQSGKYSHLRIDDDTLATSDQTRMVTTVPANFVTEVEFTGSSNLYNWTQLDWSVDSAWTVGSVSVTIQLHDYNAGQYPTSGDGYYTYSSSATAVTDETKSQTILTNPENFRNASGNWKIKIRGEKNPSTQFDFKADWIEFKPAYLSEYTSEVEFSGISNIFSIWTQLNWTVDLAWTIGSVSVTIQVHNYTLGNYPTSGDGYVAYTSSATPDTDETKNQLISVNPQHFRDATGAWKIKVTGVASTTIQFDFKADWVEYEPTYYSEYKAETEFIFSGITSWQILELNFTVVCQYDIASVTVTIQIYNYSSSSYVLSGEGYLAYTSSATPDTDETKLLNITTSIEDYVSSGNAKIKVTGINTTTTQFQQRANQVKLDLDQPIATSDHYPSSYSIVTGTHSSGTVPTSLTTADSDFFIVQSSGSATSSIGHNPSAYSLLGSTSLVSGSVSNLTSDDGAQMVFRSYYTGTDIEDYVDNNTNNVDSSVDKGTHSNFTAQQYGPDLISDALTEENMGGSGSMWLYVNSFDGEWNAWDVVGTNPYLDAVDYDLSYVNASGNLKTVGSFNFTDSGKTTETINNVTVQLYAKQSDVGKNLEVKVWVNSNWYTLGDQVTPTSWGWVNWTATTELDTWTKINAAKIHIKTKAPSSTYYVDCARLKVDYTAPDNHEVDLEVQWTAVDYGQLNEELCIYAGTTGSEDLRIDYWNGSSWINLFTDLTANSWNNVTVSLTSANFTIRFKGGTEISDPTQSTWDIDATLLHVWTDQYTTEVEFTGTSNLYTLTQLNWTIDSAWTIGSVSVTLQLYNSTLGNYPAGGNGYIAYTSSATPDTDETKYQLITVNPEHFRNSTGGWKIKVKGVASTTTQFDFKADWIEYEPTYYSEYTASTEFIVSDMPTDTPVQLNFTVVSQYDIGSVEVTIQVYNYSDSSYVISGEGYLQYTSSATPSTDEIKTLSISTNPRFYNSSSGNVKINITAVKTTTTQFQKKPNQIKHTYVSRANIITFDYVLAVTEQAGDPWKIRLKAYSESNIERLQNCTVYFHNSSDGISRQIYIQNGSYINQTGPWYDLGASETIYIAMTVKANTPEISYTYIYVYLEILVPDTTTYAQYIITLKIT